MELCRRCRLWMAIDNELVTSVEVCDESIDHPTTRREEGVQHDHAVDLALACGVLGDVGDPQPVRIVAVEVAVDEVAHCWHVVLRSTPSRAWQALQAGSTHQNLHRVVTDADPLPEGQFGVNTAGPVGARRRNVDLGDHLGSQAWRTDRFEGGRVLDM